MQACLDARCSTAVNGRDGRTPLMMSCEGQNLEVLRMILERAENGGGGDGSDGSEADAADGGESGGETADDPLPAEAEAGGKSVDTAAAPAAPAKLDPMAWFSQGAALLHVQAPAAAAVAASGVVAALDLEAVDDSGWDAVMFAAKLGFVDGVRLLLKAGATATVSDLCVLCWGGG